MGDFPLLDGYLLDLNYLPYRFMAFLLRNLDSTDLSHLVQVFPGGDLESVANALEGQWTYRKLLPLVLPHLPLNDALMCRKICYRWREYVDNCLENVGLPEPTDYSQPVESVVAWRDRRSWRKNPFAANYGWENTHGPDSVVADVVLLHFLAEMETHPGNPFPFRTVTFNHVKSLKYWGTVQRFVERFGVHIWKLHVSCYHPNARATLFLRNILKYTPNLRLLDVSLYHATSVIPALSEAEELQIEQSLADEGFPVLPHLQYLDGGFEDHFSRWALPRYSNQLVRWIPAWDSFFRKHDSQRLDTFQNLKLMHMDMRCEDDFQTLSRMECPLKNLTISCYFHQPLFKYLDVVQQTFSQTLEYLCVDRREIAGNSEERRSLKADGMVWEFPKLVTIHLIDPNPFESLDLLLGIRPGPTTLRIVTAANREHGMQEMKQEEIQVHGYLDKLYESDIWKKLPRLETVEVVLYLAQNVVYDEDYDDVILERVYTRSENKRRREWTPTI